MIAVMIAGATAGVLALFVHPRPDLGLPHSRARSADPRQGGPRPGAPHGQAGHADDGRPRDHRRCPRRLARRPPAPRVFRSPTRRSSCGSASLAMAFMGFLDDYIKVRRRHNRGIFWKQKNYVTMLMSFGIAWWLVAATGIAETVSLTRADYPGWDLPVVGVGDLGRADHLGHDQRRQRHRRARRARRRIRADGVRRVHDHRLLGVPQSGHLRRGGQPARPGRARRRLRRRLHGVPLVQRRPGADHHGRRRRARAGFVARAARVDDRTPSCCWC